MNDPARRTHLIRVRLITILLVASGILFTCLWIYAHVIWAVMSGMANLMANDSGRATGFQWGRLIGGMFIGQMIAASAGIPGGLAFFWRGRRKLLLSLFAILFVVGALCQVSAFFSFFSAPTEK